MLWRLLLVGWMCMAPLLHAEEARIIKVLPHLLDAKGRNALAPSLFERDAYQAQLRAHPDQIAAVRVDVQIKAKHRETPLLLKLELRTSKTELGKVQVFQTAVVPARWLSTWAKIQIDKATYDTLGPVIAWRATLWDGTEQVAEQESFLW
ncbi:MAG TPA: hypothetical protein VGR78_02670 [Verrucomicrobiae bacterium]|jgi:hypothetical protein|nr:hypothetical protein [Verrucomicrobiae bacterium]